jgi:hypothetical protein
VREEANEKDIFGIVSTHLAIKNITLAIKTKRSTQKPNISHIIE